MISGKDKLVFVVAVLILFIAESGISFASAAIPSACDSIDNDSSTCTIYAGKAGRNQVGLLIIGLLALVTAVVAFVIEYGLAEQMLTDAMKVWVPAVVIGCLLALSTSRFGVSMSLKSQCDSVSNAKELKGMTTANITIYVVELLFVLGAGAYMYYRSKNPGSLIQGGFFV